MKLEKFGGSSLAVCAMPAKIIKKKKMIMVGVPDEICVISFYNSTEAFCVWLKVPNYDLSAELSRIDV